MKFENIDINLTDVESVEDAITDVQEKIAEMRKSLFNLESTLWSMGVEINQTSDGVAG